MLAYKDCKGLTEYEADDFPSALLLISKLRKQDHDSLLVINVHPSTSKGQFVFPFSNVCLKGEGCLITGDKYANQYDEDGIKLTTWKTPTLTITGSNNTFIGFSIQNTSGNPSLKGTSVALSLYGDQNSFISCRIDSTQDTLFLGPLPDDLSTRYLGFLPEEETSIEGNLRNYFFNSEISGSVDFIFGAGQGVFKNCEIKSVEDGRMSVSYVTAPAHSLKDTFGFLFYDCSFTSDSIFCQRVYLGRPWRDYGKACFISCSYGPHIKDEGFIDWSSSSFRYQTARFLEFPLNPNRVEWMFNRKVKKIPEEYLAEIEKIS